MEKVPSFNALVENAITSNWDRDALTDYKGGTLQYHDVARKIAKLHIMFDYSGIKPGDKIALCGRNSSCWGCAFLAVVTYGAVVVPIQHEFLPEQVYNIVNHSEAKLLFLGDVAATSLDAALMPHLQGIFYLPDFSLIASRSERLTVAREHLNELYGQKYPKYFRKEHVSYYHDSGDDLAMINYTSGTTGFSKGVMLPYRSLWSNLDFLLNDIGSHLQKHCSVLSILPMAHMYGLSCEFLLQFCCGNHLFFLTRVPSPTVIQEAFLDIRPNIIISVPLIIEKIVKADVFPLVNNSRTRMLMKMPGVGKIVKERILRKVLDMMGGNLYEVVIGGASLSSEVEAFFTDIHFPMTVGYGTTETGPMISYADHRDFVPGSCGKAVRHMEVKVLSRDPEHEAGEIVTRGLNVMQGYYKNKKATESVIDKDGWFHTGDLARMDSEGNLFILGRIKNMLLGSNGQNVYPEEIEDRLNAMAMVSESIIVQQGDRLVGLVYPDHSQAESLGITAEDLPGVMEQNRRELNAILPAFSRISEIRLQESEFEKTPKRSIKRYLYQNTI